jgi:hypothetical protein
LDPYAPQIRRTCRTEVRLVEKRISHIQSINAEGIWYHDLL